ncbi:MAG: hypothetical protein IKZ58_07990 [Selenomonadaceae bacterium]|nr:hypothetical protein [Selenomonadaceae bacterium]
MANNATNTFKKKTFALELNGVEIKTLEDLQENFNLEQVVEYFKSGELLDWLADRFYDDEADAIENISADDRNLAQKICAALNVECDEDLEFTQRIREKKKILAEKTDDESIINNATITALNQDDLANLLHMDYSTIYLCGDSFNVPIRMTGRKYIGILGTPKIKIKANSDEELDAKNISFENCKLAWHKESPIEAMKALAAKIFGTSGEWQIIDQNKKVISSYDKLSKAEKSIAVDMCCHGKYKESEIVFMMIRDDFSDGFAFTIDSFCTGGTSGGNSFKYKNTGDVTFCPNWIKIYNKDNSDYRYIDIGGCIFYFNENLSAKVKKFLDVVKNL